MPSKTRIPPAPARKGPVPTTGALFATAFLASGASFCAAPSTAAAPDAAPAPAPTQGTIGPDTPPPAKPGAVQGLPPAAREQLRQQLETIVHRNPMQKARVGIDVRSVETGEVLYQHDPDEPLNPASNVKLITAATAFAKLGPEFRFATDFDCEGPVTKGECKTLYIRGRGDPTLYSERIFGIAGELLHRGLHRVGDIVVDDTYFDGEREGAGWEQEHGTDKPYTAPIGAVSVNHNTVAIYVSPGDSEKSKARIELEPNSDYFIVDNRVRTASRHGRQRLIPRSTAAKNRQKILVVGRLPLGRETSVFYKKVDDPPIYAGETFKTIFKARGIAVHGKVRTGTRPDDAVQIYVSRSDELANIVREMDKISSNFVAEQLIKTVGAETRGPPGTWPKGLAAADEFLASIGIPHGTYIMKNGSGLNDTNRFSATQMAQLLTAVATRTTFYPEFASSLGIAGRDGTVRSRMEGTPAEGRLRAKTGTLESVTALSGYVRLQDSETLVYSIITNDISPRHHAPYLAAMDALGAAIASGGFPDQKPDTGVIPGIDVSDSQASMQGRIATYSNLGKQADPTNLPFLHNALRQEHDPVMRAIVADAIFRSDKENGASVLLDAVPADAATFARLRTIAQQLSVPTPTLSSLIDLAADGNADALDKLVALTRDVKGDAAVDAMLADGFQEIARTAPDELFFALHRAPADAVVDATTLLADGIASSEEKAAHPFFERLKEMNDGEVAAPAAALAEKLRGLMAQAKAPAPPVPAADVKQASAPSPTSTSAPGGG
jgi:D-alanyl-D-alanine carboxypeptidase/D-alanyl-D-alanine-endopeptidase (penicillin-binding protein 4)